MPREEHKTDGHLVNVQWGRGAEYVQLGVTTQDGRSIGALIEEEVNNAAGQGVELTAPLTESTGLFGTLTTRAGINDLIRTLKRARDGAFGRDE